jgi:hypothetical protein
MSHQVIRRLAAGGVLAILVAATQVMTPYAGAGKPASPSGITYSGEAFVAYANLLGGTVVLPPTPDTGQLPSSGGMIDKSLLTISYPAPNPNTPASCPAGTSQLCLLAEVAPAFTEGSGNSAHSTASVAEVQLTLGSPPSLTISADVLKANSHVTCTNGSAVPSGSADIANLTINGQSINAAAPANTLIDLSPLAKIYINEQHSSSSGGSGSIAVNALHVILLNGQAADVIISHAESDVSNCPGGPKPPPPPCPVLDFVTGGGYITYNNGTKVTFGMVGGQKPNGLQGHLTVIDHGTGQKIMAGTVTAYSAPSANTRQVTYTDGNGNTWVVTVTDNGEPGTNDLFSISGPNGYTRSGQLGPGKAGGGNIQIHQPEGCQSNKKGH